jgi:hypothetical protein
LEKLEALQVLPLLGVGLRRVPSLGHRVLPVSAQPHPIPDLSFSEVYIDVDIVYVSADSPKYSNNFAKTKKKIK